MKTIGLGIATLLFSATALAAPKPCEELKAEIETKIQSAGVTSYTLVDCEVVGWKRVLLTARRRVGRGRPGWSPRCA